MILADTHVVSEFMKEAPDPVVMEWAHGVDPRDLEHRWGQLLDSFSDSVAVYDVTQRDVQQAFWLRPKHPAGQCLWRMPR